MRLASFNIENLFSRPAVMNRDTWSDGREVLNDVERLNTLLAKPQYSATDRTKIEAILDKYAFWNRNASPAKRGFIIQEVRERLFKVPRGTQHVEVIASGRDAWVGWVELVHEELPGQQIVNTGRVLEAVGADVACVVECENRLALDRFNDQVLGTLDGGAFAYDMVIDGNDPRGIDLGLLSRFPITGMCSHLHRADTEQRRIFSRDCPEYEVSLPDGTRLWVLCNHFKSKGYGAPAASNARRLAQAQAVAEIYAERRAKEELVAVCGDLNDTPDSAPLAPLLQQSDLQDIATRPSWEGPVGTYGSGNSKSSKIDYILLSPAMWELVTAVGIERRGIYAPRSIVSFDGVTKTTAASDHAALWVDLDLAT